MENEFKIAFEDPGSGLFEIHKPGSPERGQCLTEPEFRMLQELMPDTKWIVVKWVRPPLPTWHPDHPSNKKQDETTLNLNNDERLN